MATAAPNIESVPITIGATPRETYRLLFVDNIRTFLTMLVITHHLMIIYTSSGSWLYLERRQDDISTAIGGWFCAVNQAYFMGLFLLVAAYFVPGAYDRKGPRKFLVDRLIRLGIPLVLYSLFLRPLFIFFGIHPGSNGFFWHWYTSQYFRNYGLIGGGPVWFIETLLLFSFAYLLWRLNNRSKSPSPVKEGRFPSNGMIALFALMMGVASFFFRVVSPVNATFVPLNLQFANISQYIALFSVGLIAYRRNWFKTLPESTGRFWLWIAILLILLYGPLAVLTGAIDNVEPFLGGWHWQSLVFALWDASVSISMSISLIFLFRRRLNRQSPLAHELSRSAYAAYLIHEPILTFLAIFAAGVMVYPLLKFLLAGVVCIPLCFALGGLVRRLPHVDRVL